MFVLSICLQGPVSLYVQSVTVDRTESRSSVFTEEESYSSLPLEEANIVCDVAVSRGIQLFCCFFC